jgi:hypothetical protein
MKTLLNSMALLYEICHHNPALAIAWQTIEDHVAIPA